MQAFETLLLTQHTATAQPGEHGRAFAAVPTPDALMGQRQGFGRMGGCPRIEAVACLAPWPDGPDTVSPFRHMAPRGPQAARQNRA
jgi:hypothetical protein